MKKILAFLKGLKGIVKYIGYVLAVIVFVIVMLVSCNNGKLKKQGKSDAARITYLESRIDSLTKDIVRLGSMDAVRVDVTLQVKNTNVLGVTNIKAEQIAHTIASYTRKDILDSLVSSK